MSAAFLEIEAKFDVDPGAVLPDLSHLPKVATIDEPTESDLTATYFDTPALDLLAAGITLRRRAGGTDAGWHLKIPFGDDRYELQEPLGHSTAMPGRVLAIVFGLTRGEPLQEVATLRTHRLVTRLRDADHEVIAEVCDDVVDATTTAAQVPPDQHWREWELELKRPSAALAKAGAARLLDAGALRSAAPSKLSRVLPAPTTHPTAATTTPQPGALASEVLGSYLTAQAAHLRYLDPLVRADLPDAVHQMRVTARRLRGVLLGYDREFEAGQTARIRKDLGWLADELGRARDLEVLRQRIATTAGQARDSLAPVEAQLADSHERAHLDAIAAMASPRYFALIDNLAAFTAAPPWSTWASQPAAVELSIRLRHQWRDLDAAARDVRGTKGAERAGRLHELRRMAKRLRYCTEAAEPILGAHAHHLVHELAALQDALGNHHDAVLARRIIRTFSDDEMAPSAHAVGRKLAAEAKADDRIALRLLKEIRRAPEIRWLR